MKRCNCCGIGYNYLHIFKWDHCIMSKGMSLANIDVLDASKRMHDKFVCHNCYSAMDNNIDPMGLSVTQRKLNDTKS